MKIECAELFAYFTLTHPLMLLFGLGALIPLLIHYWNRHNHVRMSWAANHYLQLAMKRVVRRFTMLQVLLLILRVAVVVLMTLCLTLPMFDRDYQLFQQRTESTTLKVIAIDNSFSMQAMEQNRSRMDEAKKKAYSLIDNSNSTDAFTVFTFASQLVPEVSEPTADMPLVLSAIDGISGTQKTGNLRNVLHQILDVCNAQSFQDFDKIELHIISDYASKDWLEVISNKDPKIRKLEETLIVIRHPITNLNLANNYVSAVALHDSVSIAGKANVVKVEVQNRGGNANQDVIVDLMVDGTVVDNKTISLPPNQNATAQFDLVLEKPGDHELIAQINDDNLNLDNRRYQVVNVRSHYQILLLEERSGSSRFLQLALDPSESNQSIFQFKRSSPTQLNSVPLNDFDLIVVDNVRSLPKVQVNRLKQYVASGGRLVMFLGDLVERRQFNRSWNDNQIWSLGIELVGTQPVADYRLDPLGYKSDFLQAFRGNPQAGLAEIPIWCYFKVIQPKDDPNIETHLAFRNGDPLLLSKRIDRGAFVLYASSSSSQSKTQVDSTSAEKDVPWNANETVPAFLGLVQEIFAKLFQSGKTESVLVGGLATDSIEERNQVISNAMTNKDGEEIDLDFQQENGLVSYQSEPLNRSGVYQVSIKTPKSEKIHLVAVNLDPDEGDLRTMEFDDVSSTFQSSDAESTIFYVQLFQFALILLGVLLLMETIAAYRFGQGRG